MGRHAPTRSVTYHYASRRGPLAGSPPDGVTIEFPSGSEAKRGGIGEVL